jgi:hypothetical protein
MNRKVVQVMLAACKTDASRAITVAEVAAHFGVLARTIQRIAREPAVTERDDTVARRQRGVGRPSVVAVTAHPHWCRLQPRGGAAFPQGQINL